MSNICFLFISHYYCILSLGGSASLLLSGVLLLSLWGKIQWEKRSVGCFMEYANWWNHPPTKAVVDSHKCSENSMNGRRKSTYSSKSKYEVNQLHIIQSMLHQETKPILLLSVKFNFNYRWICKITCISKLHNCKQ